MLTVAYTSGLALRSTGTVVAFALLFLPASASLNVGLIAGDCRRQSSPLVIKKLTRHAPIIFNIHAPSKHTLLSPPRLPPKPPPTKFLNSFKPSKKLPRSILSPIPKLPKLPLLPILPILPPILPPLLPFLPKLPLLPILPPLPLFPLSIIPKLKPLKPLRVPILKRSALKTLEPELKITKLLPIKLDKTDGILDRLVDLKKRGSLTAAEFAKFKKLLLKK